MWDLRANIHDTLELDILGGWVYRQWWLYSNWLVKIKRDEKESKVVIITTKWNDGKEFWSGGSTGQ